MEKTRANGRYTYDYTSTYLIRTIIIIEYYTHIYVLLLTAVYTVRTTTTKQQQQQYDTCRHFFVVCKCKYSYLVNIIQQKNQKVPTW